MALLHPKLLPILALFLNMLANNYVHSQKVTSFTYPYFNKDSKNLTLQGDANIPSSGDLTISLTKISDDLGLPKINSVGRVVYSSPVQFWEPGRQSSFETNIVFIVKRTIAIPGCGIAFFIGPVGTTIPPGSFGQGLGIFELWPRTAPSIFAAKFDVCFREIGININSRRSVNDTSFQNGLEQLVRLEVNYKATSRTISVRAIVGFTTDYEVSYVHDLKTVLPQRVQVGISAATGIEVARHEVLAWHFNSSLESDGEEIENEGAYIRQYV